jgi:pSer/pThr/pTyr-binding forkhead associated (FHA) protein/tetratricopeptide (TPR) repeat protein
MKITLTIYDRDQLVTSQEFSDGTYRIGRSDFSDIVLEHESVSRSHVEIRVTESSVYVTNMSAPGRMKINGTARETAELADGDEIGVGCYRVVVMFRGIDAAAGAPLPEAQPKPGALPDGNVDGGFGGNENFGGNVQGADGGDANGGFGFGALPDAPADGVGGADALGQPEEGGVAVADAPDESSRSGSASNQRTDVAIKPIVARIVFTEGARIGEEVRIDSYEATLGRSRRADVHIDDEKLSRIHAKICRVGTGYRIVDNNSRNGTYVNGMRVLEHPLSSFDEVQIGRTKFKFLISDVAMNIEAGALVLAENTAALPAHDATKSVALAAIEPSAVNLSSSAGSFGFPSDYGGTVGDPPPPEFAGQGTGPFADPEKRRRILIGAVVGLLLLYMVLPSGQPPPKPADPAPDPQAQTGVVGANMPKEYAELSPDLQRIIEGHYNSAQRAAELSQYEESVGHLRKIHEYLPYYKDSRDLLEVMSRKLREKQIAEAQAKAKQDEKQDLQIYLNEGLEYLSNGDFDRAAEAFNSAIVIDPTNQVAIKGLKAAEVRVRSIDELPPERDPEEEKRKLVADLFSQAYEAFTKKSYQEAIEIAERIRQIELRGDTSYLSDAKNIIEKAREAQKQEFEPFLVQAGERYAEGDYNASRDLCEEMLKRDPFYEEAKECVLKAKRQLNRLAKEAYVYGYILESMNRLEDAKQYWNRAKNYVRPGDEYYDKVNKKLETYQ